MTNLEELDKRNETLIEKMTLFKEDAKYLDSNDRCGRCRYCYRSVFSEPCKTGMHLLCYSGVCAAYKPSLKTIIKNLFGKLKGEKDGKDC